MSGGARPGGVPARPGRLEMSLCLRRISSGQGCRAQARAVLAAGGPDDPVSLSVAAAAVDGADAALASALLRIAADSAVSPAARSPALRPPAVAAAGLRAGA